MFADIATIEVRAGKGGDGRLSFRHEKYRAMGGPDGGDGGKGGDIIFKVDHNSSTLSSYRNSRHIVAEDGEIGGGNRKHGKNGNDAVINVPQGTQIWDGNNLVIDLAKGDQQAVIARGGRGGFGNAHFKSSTRQAPRAAELGEQGEHFKLRLELKMVADVGLVGLPNAGKSTLLSVISNAKPEIADYPFTTLVPNLGVVDIDQDAFLVADIPGLIEGASEGKGLGDEFLRHIERTSILLQLVDAGSADSLADFEVINHELEQYQIDLSAKPKVLVISKVDTVEPEQVARVQGAIKKAAPALRIFQISAQTHDGLVPLLRAVATMVRDARLARAEAEEAEALPVIDTISLPDFWTVQSDDQGVFRVRGDRIEGFARRTNFDQDAAVERLRDILRKIGVAKELRRQGIKDGDRVVIGHSELAWYN